MARAEQETRRLNQQKRTGGASLCLSPMFWLVLLAVAVYALPSWNNTPISTTMLMMRSNAATSNDLGNHNTIDASSSISSQRPRRIRKASSLNPNQESHDDDDGVDDDDSVTTGTMDTGNNGQIIKKNTFGDNTKNNQQSEDEAATPRLPNGWRPIHIFTGSDGMQTLFDREDFTKQFQSHNEQNPRWSGQIEQDQLVWQLLGQKKAGYFVELAANDAIYLSNSFALEQYQGWNGICVEGNPQYWFWLGFRKCHVVGAMVSGHKGEKIRVNFDAAETGGIVGLQGAKKRLAPSKTEPRQTTTLMEILDTFQAPRTIDYLSLDVEGAEEIILKSFDFDQYTFSLLTVERASRELQRILTANGYVRLRVLDARFGESLWKHQDAVLAPNVERIMDDWCASGLRRKCIAQKM